MKKGKSCLFLIALLVFVPVIFSGCGYDEGAWRHSSNENFFVDVKGAAYSEKDVNVVRERITSEELLNEFLLASIKAHRDLYGELQGSFFLGSGSVSGSLEPKNTYLFFWTKEGVTYIAELPATKIVFLLDEDTVQPTVKFKFQIVSKNIWDQVWKENSSLRDNPNIVISPDYVSLAFIRITPDKLGEYILIP